MPASIGNCLQAVMCLRVDVGHIVELPQWPEVLADIADSSFDFAFFPSRGDVACAWNEGVLPCEGEKPRIEAHEPAFVFGNDAGQVVVPQLTGDATQRVEGVEVTTQESFE